MAPNRTTLFSSIVSDPSNLHARALLTDLSLDSGHGGQTKDLDGDEADGYDEGLSSKILVVRDILMSPLSSDLSR